MDFCKGLDLCDKVCLHRSPDHCEKFVAVKLTKSEKFLVKSNRLSSGFEFRVGTSKFWQPESRCNKRKSFPNFNSTISSELFMIIIDDQSHYRR